MQMQRQNCMWEAWGDIKCVETARPAENSRDGRFFKRESFYYADPTKYPECKETGCAIGVTCARTGDCRNGLSCVQSKCAEGNPFTSENIKRAEEDDIDEREDEKREKKMDEYRKVVKNTGKPDAKDMIYIGNDEKRLKSAVQDIDELKERIRELEKEKKRKSRDEEDGNWYDVFKFWTWWE